VSCFVYVSTTSYSNDIQHYSALYKKVASFSLSKPSLYFIHSVFCLNNMSTASPKESSPQSVIWFILFHFAVSSTFLKVIQ